MTVIDDGLGHLSDQSINWITATEDVELVIPHAGLSESAKRAKIFAKLCNLNNSLAAKVKDLDDAEPIQDPNKVCVAANQEINVFEEELQIENGHPANLVR
jgi:hypothetical protein